MLNIVLPIAGRGSRFADAGYKLPKPLIPVHGIPMIEVVVNNIRPIQAHRFIFVALKEHLEYLGMRSILTRIAPNCLIIPVEEVTQGAACTVLLAKTLINNDAPLMIANSDQWVDIAIDSYLTNLDSKDADGLIMTMTAHDKKWSYIAHNKNGWVSRVVEKEVISSEATVGIYNFRHGKDFVLAAEQMIAKEMRVNGEFYVAPIYNEMIAAGKKISFQNIDSSGQGMHGLGIPSDLNEFLAKAISQKIFSKNT